MLPNEDCAVRDVEENLRQSFRWREHLAESTLLCENYQCMGCQGWCFEACESRIHAANSHPNELF